jgi:hypothetical protein
MSGSSGANSGTDSGADSGGGFLPNLQSASSGSLAPKMQSALRCNSPARHKQRWVAGNGGLPPSAPQRATSPALAPSAGIVDVNCAVHTKLNQNLLAAQADFGVASFHLM